MRQKQRGRVSGAARLAQIRSPDLAPTPARPEPPRGELESDQQETWRIIVARMPSYWFPQETWALLVQYCRIKSRLDYIAKCIIEVHSDSKAKTELAPLFRLERQLSDTLMALAAKMRLCHSAITIVSRTHRPEVVDEEKVEKRELWERESA